MTNKRSSQGIRYRPQCYLKALETIFSKVMCSSRHVRGHLRSTTVLENKFFVTAAKVDRHTTASVETTQLIVVTGKRIYIKKLQPDVQNMERYMPENLLFHRREFTAAPAYNGFVSIAIGRKATGLVCYS